MLFFNCINNPAELGAMILHRTKNHEIGSIFNKIGIYGMLKKRNIINTSSSYLSSLKVTTRPVIALLRSQSYYYPYLWNLSSRGVVRGIQESLNLTINPEKSKKSLDPVGFATGRLKLWVIVRLAMTGRVVTFF